MHNPNMTVEQSTKTLPLLKLKGSPREMGLEHGRTMKNEIEHNLEVYFKRFKGETKLTRDQVLDRAGKYSKAVRETAPAYMETMEGVASGSKNDLLEIVALNVRYELMYSQYSKLGTAAVNKADGCTAFGIMPEMSKDGHALLAQNWDWIPEVEGVFLDIAYMDAPRVLCFSEAGVVGGKIGLNTDGLGMLINGLVSNEDDWSRLETPFHVMCWQALQSRSIEDAVAIVSSGKHSCSANFLFGQQTRPGTASIVNIESGPNASNAIGPDHGIVAHTNHFCDPSAVGISQIIDEEWRSTLTRYERITEILDSHVKSRQRLGLEDVEKILRDHDSRPDSICRHPNPDLAEDDRYKSVVSVVMDLKNRDLWATDGSPCDTVYRLIGF